MNSSALLAAIASYDLRSCLISRSNKLLFEHYRNRSIPGEISKINSCTKSILSALICIAMDEGLLPAANTPISVFFPELDADPDPRKRAITLEHLLTMTAGFDWTEFGGQNSFPRMTRTDDWVRFALDQPMAETPGARMEYNSGASQLLSAILAQAVGNPVARFAEERLFSALDIRDYRWESDPKGIHTGGFGLWLRPSDMLAFGQLFLGNGLWQGRRLLSEKRVKISTQPYVTVNRPNRGFYGWHWWIDSFGPDELETREGSIAFTAFDYYYARGYGGQFIYIIPKLETVVVLTDDKRKKDRSEADVFRQSIAPILASAAD
ncbi:serine hydrolase [Paenibacillus sp. HB172176]|uniref:serine hydrolase domain-containing protein n=1 Tax=Paenibacillus sp. HB172176 TaxID=2493690 RepID=UPI00143C79D2|nr:serine hydrolase [Paenibacillus sp. HB172176]